MNNKAFSLVELLGVITLVAILALITMPIINNAVDNSRKKTFKVTLNAIVDTVKIYNAETDYLEITEDVGMDVLSSDFKYENKSEIKGGQIFYKSGTYYFENVTTNYYCAFGYIEAIEIYEIDSEECN